VTVIGDPTVTHESPTSPGATVVVCSSLICPTNLSDLDDLVPRLVQS
jgi:hypothetical protein